MQTPEPWAFLLLLGGALRLTRLIGWDTITDGLRARVTGWHSDGRQAMRVDRRTRQDVWHTDRKTWQLFVTCPWCLGFWVALAVWGSWQILPDATIVACTPLALSEAIGLTVKTLDE